MAKPTLLLIPAAAIALGAWWWNSGSRGAAPTAPGAAASAPASASTPTAAGTGRAVQTVSVYVAQRQDVPVSAEANGTVVALDDVSLNAQVAATIREVRVRSGQTVRRGDVLFVFDDRVEQANLDKARAQVLRTQAALADLDRQVRRAQELREQNFLAPSAVDSLQGQMDVQRATLAADQAAIKSAETALSFSTVRAPISGRAGLVTLSPGALVMPSSAPLVTLTQLDRVGVNFTLPEAQLQNLLQSQRGKTPLEVTIVPAGGGSRSGAGPAATAAAAAAAPAPGASSATAAAVPASVSAPPGQGPSAGQPVKGTVRFVDSSIDATTGTIKARADFDNRQQFLWPGQSVRLRLTLRTLEDAVVIPQAALILRGSDRSVYVVGADKTAQMRPVQVRQGHGELVVVEGVQPGEKIVVDGKQNLRPGGAVRDVPMVAEGSGRRGAAGSAGAASGAASGSAGSAPAVAASGARP
jgi:membrane fusion protein, multidrug efflux system